MDLNDTESDGRVIDEVDEDEIMHDLLDDAQNDDDDDLNDLVISDDGNGDDLDDDDDDDDDNDLSQVNDDVTNNVISKYTYELRPLRNFSPHELRKRQRVQKRRALHQPLSCGTLPPIDYDLIDKSDAIFRSMRFHYSKRCDRYLRAKKFVKDSIIDEQRRVSKMNPNYFNHFLIETRAFKEFHSEHGPDGLIGSYITSKGRRIPKYLAGIDTTCSFWTSREKDLFFELLGRYTITRVETIQKHLKTKSILEIFTYYNLLKRETEEYKRDPVKFTDLVSMNEIPASYEMSNEFVDMETSQATESNTFIDLDRELVDKKDKRRRRWITDPIPDLINKENMQDLSNTIYAKGNIIRHHRTGKWIMQFSPTSYWLFGAEVKNLTYEIILKLIELKLSKLNKDSLDVFYRRRLLKISQHDIRKVVIDMKLNRPRKLRAYWDSIIKRLKLYVLNDEDMKNPDDEAVLLRAKWRDMQRVEHRVNPLTKEQLRDHRINPQGEFDKEDENENETNNVNGDEEKEEEEEEEEEVFLDASTDYLTAIKHATKIDDLDERKNRGLGNDAIAGGYLAGLRSKGKDKRSLTPEEVISDYNWIVDADEALMENEELVEKMFLYETALLARQDYERSLKYENIILKMLSLKSDQILMNDETMSKLYVNYKYYPQRVGYKIRPLVKLKENVKGVVQRSDIEIFLKHNDTTEDKYDLNLPDEELYTYYNESDPFTVPYFPDITEDMMLLHAYHYADYSNE
ncbi:hypothetical protein CANARDRAFT_10234 [[Candida] arabinofermentans NRRL YB-2248]|uniref:Myb-like domain-containing protein n=1 Tax=[Candida] arabinofermentans NRRL YB-2248 TaxID=983967 RepID=A0A1E4STD3_9ASCO|nr:hypothetical protein CANARDRAFT_10234 [[Candida] arabinofermentans NRRL YB-2248]